MVTLVSSALDGLFNNHSATRGRSLPEGNSRARFNSVFVCSCDKENPIGKFSTSLLYCSICRDFSQLCTTSDGASLKILLNFIAMSIAGQLVAWIFLSNHWTIGMC